MVDFSSKIISSFSKTQLPEILQNENETFVEFLSAYYEYMEQKGKVTDISKNLTNYDYLSETIDEFSTYFEKEIAEGIPINVLSNKRLFAKYIKDLYDSKGTEQSYKFFFKLIYNEDIELYYPKDDILKASDGVWVQNKKIIIQQDNRLFESIGLTIRGRTTGTEAIIDDISIEKFGNFFAMDLKVTITNNNFEPDEILDVINADGTFYQIFPFSVIEKLTIVNGGTNYSVGDVITITDVDGVGQFAEATVSSVDGDGKIRNIELSNFGVNYSQNVTASVAGGNSDAVITATVGYVGTEIGSYLNNRGHLSSNKYLQDSNFYQEYSYVIRSGLIIDRYKNILKKILHPAGIALFGQILIKLIISYKKTIKTDLIIKFVQSLITLNYLSAETNYIKISSSDINGLIDISNIDASTNHINFGVNKFYDLVDYTYVTGNVNHIVSGKTNISNRLGEIDQYSSYTIEDINNYFGLYTTQADFKLFIYLGTDDINIVIDTNREEIRITGIGDYRIGSTFIIN